MRARDLIIMARQRAGLTQAQLARRSGYPRETIARWERGGREPSFSTIVRVVRATDLDLVASLVRTDDSLLDLTRDQLAYDPEERLGQALLGDPSAWAGLEALSRAATPFVLIGQLAAIVQGDAQRPTLRTPVLVSQDARAMATELEEDGFEPVDNDERWRTTDPRPHWRHPRGHELALATEVPGTAGYPDLRRNTYKFWVFHSAIEAAHPRDLLRIAEASPREDERARAPGLRALLELLEESRSD